MSGKQAAADIPAHNDKVVLDLQLQLINELASSNSKIQYSEYWELLNHVIRDGNQLRFWVKLADKINDATMILKHMNICYGRIQESSFTKSNNAKTRKTRSQLMRDGYIAFADHTAKQFIFQAPTPQLQGMLDTWPRVLL